VLRAVLDTNLYVAALLSRDGSPARIVCALHDGVFDAIACPALLEELAGVLARPKLASRIPPEDARAFVTWLERVAIIVPDSTDIVAFSPDPGDDYLLALAQKSGAKAIVSGDAHLLELESATGPASGRAEYRVLTPAVFAGLVDSLR